MKLPLFLLTLATTYACTGNEQNPKNIRTSFQWIEVSHPQLTQLMRGEKKSGITLHAAVMNCVKESKAKIVDTEILVTKIGQKSKIESIREEIYPTEYSPPGSISGSHPRFAPDIRGIVAFETRNAGVSIEAKPYLAKNEKFIDLTFAVDVVDAGSLATIMEHKDQWGDASIRMPFYDRQIVSTSLILASGKFELVNVFSPRSTPAIPSVAKRILLFVRADVLQ
jgi:hypothetical protein